MNYLLDFCLKCNVNKGVISETYINTDGLNLDYIFNPIIKYTKLTYEHYNNISIYILMIRNNNKKHKLQINMSNSREKQMTENMIIGNNNNDTINIQQGIGH